MQTNSILEFILKGKSTTKKRAVALPNETPDSQMNTDQGSAFQQSWLLWWKQIMQRGHKFCQNLGIKALSLWTIGVPSIEGGTMLWEGKGCLVYKGTGWKWSSCYKSLFSHIALLSVTWEHLYAFHGTSEMSLLSFSHFRWSFRVSQGSTKVGVIYFSKIMNLYSILLSCYLSNEATPSSCGCM